MGINRNNYETHFLLYLDRELLPANQLAVEKFLLENADLQKEMDLLKQTLFVPQEILFENKSSLLRTEEKRKVFPLYWMRIAAAITVLIFSSWFLLTRTSNRPATEIAKTEIKKTIPAIRTTPAMIKNKITPAPGEEKINHATAMVDDQKVRNKVENQMDHKKQLQPLLAKRTNQTAEKKSGSGYQTKSNDIVPASTVAEVKDPVIQQSAVALQPQPVETKVLSNARLEKGLPVIAGAAMIVPAKPSDNSLINEKLTESVSDPSSENAISVVALNEKNKSITGFFNKLTKRAPADASGVSNAKTLRISVFKISY